MRQGGRQLHCHVLVGLADQLVLSNTNCAEVVCISEALGSSPAGCMADCISSLPPSMRHRWALTLMMISMPSLLVDSGAAISSAVRNWLDTLPLRNT